MADELMKSRLHISSTVVVIMIGMMVLDAYLVQQNAGSRRTGVLVMLLIGDVCLLFVLRYVGVWVGTEVHSTKRGCSMAEWFLVVFVLDIKMYFVLEDARKGCFTEVEKSIKEEEAASTEDGGNNLSLFQPKMTFAYSSESMSTEELMIAYAQIGVRSSYDEILAKCDYAIVTKKTLTLFQAIFVPGFYLLLVGADYLQEITNLRELAEVKMRAFWVVVDLLDLLDLQSSMWESKQGELPYLTVGFIYFYCYIVLIVLPPLSLAEMSKRNEVRPHEMMIYLLASVVTINIATTAIRLVLLTSNNFAGVSSIFIGKNVVCMFFKATSVAQIYLAKRSKIRFLRDQESPFTLNYLKKEDRNHVGFTDLIIQPSVVEEDARKPEENETLRCHGNDSFNHNRKEQEEGTLMSSKKQIKIKDCNSFAPKIGSFSSSTASHRATDGSSNDYDLEKVDEIPRWDQAFFDPSSLENRLNGDQRETLNNTLPSRGLSDKFSRRLSRSFSASMETYSDGSNEKRVRFRKEKLSPVASEGQERTGGLLLLDFKEAGTEKNEASMAVSGLASSESTQPFSSTDNSTSTTDCGIQHNIAREWNPEVISQIETLKNNLNEAFGRNSSVENLQLDKTKMMSVDEELLDIPNHSKEDNDSADGEFTSRLPSPLPESLPTLERNFDSLLRSDNFGSLGSFRSEALSPLSPATSAAMYSPRSSSMTVPSSVATNSLLSSPTVDMNLNPTNLDGIVPVSNHTGSYNNNLASFPMNGFASASDSKISEEDEDDYVHPSPMFLLRHLDSVKNQFNTLDSNSSQISISAKGASTPRRAVSRASQTNLLDDDDNLTSNN